MLFAIPFIGHHTPPEPIGGADGFDVVVIALMNLSGDAELFDEFG